MSYDTYWAIVCSDHGWDYYSDCPGEHWSELSDYEKGKLEYLWHCDYDESGEPGCDRDLYW